MKNLTTGSITRHLLATGSFMLVTMVFQTLYLLIDLYWVGRLGKEAVAAVAVAGNLTFVVLAVTQMLSVGTTTLISHATGRQEHDQANVVFNQSILLSAVSGAVFMFLAWLTRDPFAYAMAADRMTARLASDYLAWFLPAMALQFPMVSMSAALRGTGNFKPGMIVQTATLILNMILSPMLIFGWPAGRPLGVAGAAISTFVAVLVAVVWLAFWFRGTTAYLHFHPTAWRPRMKLWTAMLRVGLPAGAEFALMAVHLLVVYVVSRRFGAAAQAGFGIGLRVVQACFLPVVALGVAVAPVAGQNVGAGLGERVRATFRAAATMASVYMLFAGMLCLLAPAALIAVFTDDPRVVAVGEEYLRIIAWNFVGSGVIFVSSSMFQALGNTVPPLMTSIARLLLTTIPILVLSTLDGFALSWMWYVSVASIWIHMGANLVLLHREFERRLPRLPPVLQSA